MHELSICSAIIGIVERHAAGRGVARVCIDVGWLRQVVPETLAACWEIAVAGTALDGVALDVRSLPAAITCRGCGAVTVLEHPVFHCAACAGQDLTVTSGNELDVTSLVLLEA